MAAMAVIFKYAICLLLIENAVGQYGPFPSGKTRHRTTTTTETPDVANEVLPPSPYQPPSGYKPPGSPSQPPLPSPYPGQQGQPTPPQPTPSNQPPQQPPSPQPSSDYPYPSQPSPQYPSQPPPPQSPTRPQYPPSPSGQPLPGQTTPQFPTPGQQPSSQYPTPQYPKPSGQPQSPTPSGQPSGQPQTPSGQPSPYPTPSGQPSPQYPFPSGQPSPQYPTPSGQPSPQYPTPSGQPSPQYPTPSGQPSPQQPAPSGHPSFQHPPPSGQPQYPYPSGQPSPQTPTGHPTPQFPSQPGQSPHRPTSPQYPPSSGSQFPSAPLTGQPAPQYPAPSSPGQPSPQYPGYTPGPNPSPQFPSPSGQPSPQYPAPSPGQPSPQYPGYTPGPSPSPQFPSPSGQPSAPSPGQPSPQYPGYTPGSSPSPQFPSPSGQPSAPSPGQPSPQYPGYTPGPSPSPSQQYWWANPQNPFTPGQQPTGQPIAPPSQGPAAKPPGSPCSSNLADNPFISSGCSNKPKPQQPGLGPPNRPGFPPQPQQPLPSPSRPQPGYGPQPANPSQVYQPQPSGSQQVPQPQTDSFPRPIPQRPSQNPINPNNPFLSSGLQNPVRQEAGDVACSTETAYCVPSYKCNNGLVTDPTSLPANLKKGPCSPGEVCCKVKKHTGPPSYPPQPQPAYPSQPQSYAVTETPKYSGPLNTTPYPGCAAALKCVDISYCTVQGVISNTPVALTREENENRVPITDCQDMNTGIIGKCCRDPNYKDPWPAGTVPAGPKNLDDGQYHPPAEQQFDDGQYHPSPEQGNEDKLYGTPAPATPYRPSYPQSQPGYQPGQPQQPGTPTYQPQPSQQPTYQPQPSQQPPYQPQPSQQPPYQPQPSQQPTYQPQPSQQPTYQPQPQQPGSQTYPSQSPYQPQTSQPQPQQPTPTHQSAYSQPPLKPSQSPQPTPGKECGVRRPNQGAQPDEAGFGEFPWHATIVSSSNNSALCSAAIIAPNAVITSAHCIDGLNPEDMKIKAGGHTLGQEGPKPSQIRPVGAAAIHPSYDSGSLVKDQAVIVTEEPLVFDQHIDKVCLAPTTQDEYEPSGGDCFVTGYGRPALQRNTPGTPLHKIKVNLIPKEQCENNLKKTHLGKYFILNKGFTCAAPLKESELCKVDVGSPLVCEKPDGHYELAGVYSWDTKCSTALPGVMASCDTEWIQQVLATPLEKLREQYARPQIATQLVINIESKPGFAQGYGK